MPRTDKIFSAGVLVCLLVRKEREIGRLPADARDGRGGLGLAESEVDRTVEVGCWSMTIDHSLTVCL